MRAGHWWNDTDRGKLKYTWGGRNTTHCLSIHIRMHMDWMGMEPRPPLWEADD